MLLNPDEKLKDVELSLKIQANKLNLIQSNHFYVIC